MEFDDGDDVQFRNAAGWQNGTVVSVSEMNGEYLILHGENSLWVSAHRVRTIPKCTIKKKKDGHDQIYYDVDAPAGFSFVGGEHAFVAWSIDEAEKFAQEQLRACAADCDCRH